MSNIMLNSDNIFLNDSHLDLNQSFSSYYNDNVNVLATTINNSVIDSSRATLWMGDLEPWMDESFLKQLWSSYGELVVVKLMRDKRTGLNCGYAFIGFNSTQAAQRILNTVHGTRMPNSNKSFRLNWASGGGINDRKEDRAQEYSLFVGDLSNDVDETFLLSLFRNRFPTCHSAKIMTDPMTGLSRGYGFVRFSDQSEQQDAVIEMNGILCDNRPLRVSYATPKSTSNSANKNHGYPTAKIINLNLQQDNYSSSRLLSNSYHYHLQKQRERYEHLELQAPALIHQPTDPNNTTVFVGGLSSPVTEEQLRQQFSPFGEVTSVKIPPGKGCGFVQYVSRYSAEQAIEKMNGFMIGTSRIRLSWGRSQADKTYIPSSNTPATIMDQALSPSTLSSSSMSNNNFQFRPLSPTLVSPTNSSTLFNPYENTNYTSTGGIDNNRLGEFSLLKSANHHSTSIYNENDRLLTMAEQQKLSDMGQYHVKNTSNSNQKWLFNAPF